jgi:hypothetical protein
VENIEKPSAWNLRLDLVSTRTLLWVATASGTGNVRREVHQYLSDRYQHLAVHHNACGRTRRAARLWTKARSIFASEGVAILVLILRQAHSQCPSRSHQLSRER